jgi:HK97 family phage portal protein
MGYWKKLTARAVTPNANGPLDSNPGDPSGLEIEVGPINERGFSVPPPSAWAGYPKDWDVEWQKVDTGLNQLVDIAWQCLDLQSNIVSAMPVYQTKNGVIIDPETWMSNPDPLIYSSWQEFSKQLFWDFQMGEAFIMPMATDASTGKPSRFRVVPPWMFSVDMKGGGRTYKLGNIDVTDEVLHIRYSSNTASPRGIGPLEIAGAKMLQIRLLQRYVTGLAETGGVPLYWIGVNRRLAKSEANDLLEQWMETRTQNVGQPAILGSNATLNQARTMDAKEMGLLEISQFSESRIAGLLGVPPFLVGLAGASGSLTYSNISDLFDFHDRSSLRPKTRMIMEALSAWSLPRGRSAEFNRDDYTRLPFDKRVAAYAILIANKILTADEVRSMERFQGNDVDIASQALTGGAN